MISQTVASEIDNQKPARNAWLGLVVVYGCLMSFACVFQLVPPLIPILIHELNLSHGEAGLLMSLFALPGIVLSIPAGMLVDRHGVRSIGSLSLLAMTAGTATMVLPVGFSGMLLARSVAGMGAMVAVVTLQRTVTRLFEGRPLGLPLGIVNTAIPFGIVLALNGTGRAADAWGWRQVTLAVGALAALSAIAFFILGSRLRHRPDQIANSHFAGPMTAVSFGPIWIAGAVWLLANGAMTSFVTFAPDHYLDLGFGTGSRGFFASLPMWGAALVGPLVGHWTDRHGGKRAFITVGMILMALFLALVPGGVLTPLLIGLGLALALACVPTPLLSLPADLLPPSHHGRAFGILSACANAGIFLIPPLAGTVRDASGAYLWPFMLMSLVAMLGVGVSLRLPSRDNRQWGATDRPG